MNFEYLHWEIKQQETGEFGPSDSGFRRDESLTGTIRKETEENEFA